MVQNSVSTSPLVRPFRLVLSSCGEDLVTDLANQQEPLLSSSHDLVLAWPSF